MSEKVQGLIGRMKDQINKSQGGNQPLFYVKKDSKVRVRFLNDLEDGMEIIFHSKWKSFDRICSKYFGRKCELCNREIDGMKTEPRFVYTIWNYETKRRELFIYKSNRCSPIPALLTCFEEYGTITDRDFVISRSGEGTSTVYTVMGKDKKPFKGEEEAYKEKKLLKILGEAFPEEDIDFEMDNNEDEVFEKDMSKNKKSKKVEVEVDEDDELEDDEEKEDKSKKKLNKKSKKVEEEIEDEDEDDFDDDDDEDENEDEEEIDDDEDEEDEREIQKQKYMAMSEEKLIKLCKKKDAYKKGMSKKQIIKELLLPF